MMHYLYVFTGRELHMWGPYAMASHKGDEYGSISSFVHLLPEKISGAFNYTTIWLEASVPEEDLPWFALLEKM